MKATQPRPAGWSLEWSYFALVMAAWCFTPLLRRLIDWHNGFFNPVQIASTIPFLATLPLALVALRPERLARIPSALKVLACVWVATFAYGLMLAVLFGNLAAGVYETIQYLVPMLAGLWLAIGVYLPLSTTLPIFCGGAIRGTVNHLKKKRGETAGREGEEDLEKGNLFATGLVAGGSLMGVLFAFLNIPEKVKELIGRLSAEKFLVGAMGQTGYYILGVIFFAIMGLALYRTGMSKEETVNSDFESKRF